jgi:hypothetical protein
LKKLGIDESLLFNLFASMAGTKPTRLDKKSCHLAASSFGPWTDRIQGCGTIDPCPTAGSPLVVILLTRPDCIRCAAVLGTCQGQALLAEEAGSLDSFLRATAWRCGGSGNGLSDRRRKN